MLERLNCLRVSILRTFVQEVAAFQVELIGFGVLRSRFEESFPLDRQQLQAEFLRDVLRNLLLNFEDVGGLFVILLAPDLPRMLAPEDENLSRCSGCFQEA